jgi:uncharacterized membrane protein
MTDAIAILDPLFRWTHVVAGVLWIGLLYFFNFVNGPFAATMDADAKKKVVPQLMPRALYWFRWGAAWTWATGVLLLLLVFYHGRVIFDDPAAGWGLPQILMILVVFVAPFIYDAIMKGLAKTNLKAAVAVAFVFLALYVWLMKDWAGFSYRGFVIHVGAAFGTIMAWNVWFRIWPAQRKIITAIRDGQAPDPAVVALGGMRSRQNTYMSVPLMFTMINQHHVTWSSPGAWIVLLAMVLLGWWVASMLLRKAPKVTGF